MSDDELPKWAAKIVDNLRKRGATHYVRTGDMGVLVVFPSVDAWGAALLGDGKRASLLDYAHAGTWAVRDWREELTGYGVPFFLTRRIAEGAYGRIYLAYPWSKEEVLAWEDASGLEWGSVAVRCESRCIPIPKMAKGRTGAKQQFARGKRSRRQKWGR